MATNFAPIVVSVYDRVEHLRQCIKSLKQNPLSQHSDLFIVSDAPYTKSHEGRIGKVREFIDQIEGFHRVIPVIRERNLGSFLSVKGAIDEVIDNYGKLIFLEDDNVVAPNFLNFLNDGLIFYQNDSTVFSISGFNFPVTIPVSYQHDVYRWQGFTAWGVGLWADRWQSITWGYAGYNEMTDHSRRELDRIGEHLNRYISYDITHKRMIIDTIISYYLFTHHRYSIFPVLSKVRNTGHDGTGEHGGITDRYVQQQIDPGLPYRFVRDIQANEQINRVLRRHFRTPMKVKVMMTLSRFIPERQKTWLKARLYARRALPS